LKNECKKISSNEVTIMWGILVKGGWVMAPLAFCSIAAVTITIERLFFFKRISQDRNQAEGLLSLAETGKLAEAARVTGERTWPVMKVLQAGIAYRHNPGKAMEASALSEVAAMKRGLPVLETIITLAPLLGLLGTIVGMIGSFHIMALSGAAQPRAVTAGVAEALISTAAGIIVAVATLIPYNYFMARIERETVKIEKYATQLEITLSQLIPG
jgi:biopolymer transport protein ExbB